MSDRSQDSNKNLELLNGAAKAHLNGAAAPVENFGADAKKDPHRGKVCPGVDPFPASRSEAADGAQNQPISQYREPKSQYFKTPVEKTRSRKTNTTYKRKYIRQKTHKEQNTHTTEAPDGAVCVLSIHSLQICQQYAQHMHDSGQGIDNPGGFANAIYDGLKAGRSDAAITAWLAAPAKPKPKKLHDDPNCPRCQGYGQEYVGGDIGMRRCTAGD